MVQFTKYMIEVDKDMRLTGGDEAFFSYIGQNSLGNLDQVPGVAFLAEAPGGSTEITNMNSVKLQVTRPEELHFLV